MSRTIDIYALTEYNYDTLVSLVEQESNISLYMSLITDCNRLYYRINQDYDRFHRILHQNILGWNTWNTPCVEGGIPDLTCYQLGYVRPDIYIEGYIEGYIVHDSVEDKIRIIFYGTELNCDSVLSLLNRLSPEHSGYLPEGLRDRIINKDYTFGLPPMTLSNIKVADDILVRLNNTIPRMMRYSWNSICQDDDSLYIKQQQGKFILTREPPLEYDRVYVLPPINVVWYTEGATLCIEDCQYLESAINIGKKVVNYNKRDYRVMYGSRTCLIAPEVVQHSPTVIIRTTLENALDNIITNYLTDYPEEVEEVNSAYQDGVYNIKLLPEALREVGENLSQQLVELSATFGIITYSDAEKLLTNGVGRKLSEVTIDLK